MFKVLDEVCKPTKGSKYSAAVDLYAREDVVIGAGETKIVPLGVCIDLDMLKINMFMGSRLEKEIKENNDRIFERFIKSNYLQLEPRSSLRVKGLQAGTGIIDMDYKDEIKIIIHNQISGITKHAISNTEYCEAFTSQSNHNVYGYEIKKGDKIAQILLKEHKTYLMGIESDEERTGGFGSTGN